MAFPPPLPVEIVNVCNCDRLSGDHSGKDCNRVGAMTPYRAQIVIDALRFIAGLVNTEDDQNWCIDTAQAIDDFDFIEGGWACPLCQEVVCDSGCPLEGLR